MPRCSAGQCVEERGQPGCNCLGSSRLLSSKASAASRPDTSSALPLADTWPVLLGLLEAPVGQQWIFSLFSIVSAMIGLGERMHWEGIRVEGRQKKGAASLSNVIT